MEERLARSASTLTDSRKDSNDSPEGALVSIVVEVSMFRSGPGADGVISGVVVVWSKKRVGNKLNIPGNIDEPRAVLPIIHAHPNTHIFVSLIARKILCLQTTGLNSRCGALPPTFLKRKRQALFGGLNLNPICNLNNL
ncbi:hypothetical protein NPIL_111171 [Nephila pilipes]|uniref:Uncharacterized protein n=1 Tax=Nephila pilipes TaxID=299642 RepID=A0A8X6NV93_NEPPI|nr:hypothetical protein NPIL_111171 [Nephila pilipes]